MSFKILRLGLILTISCAFLLPSTLGGFHAAGLWSHTPASAGLGQVCISLGVSGSSGGYSGGLAANRFVPSSSPSSSISSFACPPFSVPAVPLSVYFKI